MFVRDYYPPTYFALRYFSSFGQAVARICKLNIETRTNSISIVSGTGSINAETITGSLNTIVRCE